jgi:hypothetical protein
MKNILLLLFLGLCHFEGFSQNWIKITHTSTGDTIYINNKLVKKGGVYGNEDGVIRVWTKTIINKYEDNTTGKAKVYLNAVLKTLSEYDCVNQKSRLITNILYDSSGKTIYSGENHEYEMDWYFVVPESVGEIILLFACELFN